MEARIDVFGKIFDEKCVISLTRFANRQNEGNFKSKDGKVLVVSYKIIHPVLFIQESDTNEERMNEFLLAVMKEFPKPTNGEIIYAEFDSV